MRHQGACEVVSRHWCRGRRHVGHKPENVIGGPIPHHEVARWGDVVPKESDTSPLLQNIQDAVDTLSGHCGIDLE